MTTQETKAEPNTLYAAGFTKCAELQDNLNDLMAGEGWRNRATLSQDTGVAELDYGFAALDETAELWKCLVAFKWWGPNNLDYPNAKVELVDILHFGLSQELLSQSPEDVGVLLSESAYRICHLTVPNSPQRSIRNFVSALAQEPSEFYWDAYFELVAHARVTPQDIIDAYLPKALLNRFRIHNGYKAKPSTYVKHWFNGKEDNVYLYAFVDGFVEKHSRRPTANEILDYLDHTYKAVTAGLPKA